MKPGEEFVVTINMLNSGINKWTKSDNFKLSLFDQADNMFQADVWGIKEVSLPYDVNPNEKVMFLFKITAPLQSGTYNCRWVMTKNDQFFGEYTANMVTVADNSGLFSSDAEGNNSEFMYIDIPEFMNAGEKYKVIITIKNTGKNLKIQYLVIFLTNSNLLINPFLSISLCVIKSFLKCNNPFLL